MSETAFGYDLFDDVTRIVTSYTITGTPITTRPYSVEESAQATAKANAVTVEAEGEVQIATLLTSIDTLNLIVAKANNQITAADTKQVARETRRVARQVVRLSRLLLKVLDTTNSGTGD